ncbi:biopolymer transporter ExbD [Pelagibacterium sp. H642]|uniref:ExbD/TolR family protein n=1 Tax=Pelagibacterium sp. H642 TaxID=1881069 RepID=UPI0028156240|nr:biopolymer transporter ExbD [Pelagibacterium sp. H642]WMT91277.1 biopolymer transporter ExbD [Pelagibacterium sp. H642]
MKISQPKRPTKRESTIPLINVVFLMLIFFLVAGTVAPPIEGDVNLSTTEEAPQSPPTAALYADAEGALTWNGAAISAEAFAQSHAPAEGEPVRLGADRDLPAEMLIDLLGELRALGLADVVLVTERAQ